MPVTHPSWCLGTEPSDADHVSATLHAGGPEDPIDIQLRLSQPESEAGDVTPWTTLELEFVEEGEAVAFPLELHQARALMESLARLLPRTTGGSKATGEWGPHRSDPSDLGA